VEKLPKLAVSNASTPTYEKGRVHSSNHVGTRQAEHLVAPFERCAAEVVGSEIKSLHERPEGAIEDDDPFVDRFEIGLSGHRGNATPVRSVTEGSSGFRVRLSVLTSRHRSHPCSVRVVAKVRVYTREGDDGTTGLFYGGRVPKDSQLPRAYGTVDEAQSVIGMARAESGAGSELESLLIPIMRDLWVLMAELATLPENRSKLDPGVTCV